MFEKMKADAWLEGYDKGMDEAEELREIQQQSDDNGITYASHGDYMKAKVAFNAKDTEIASLKEELKDAKKVQASLAECHKELERFYLEAIGNANTVKQVKAVMKRYRESELGMHYMRLRIKGLGSIGTCASFYPILEATSAISQAAATKIKRINRRDAEEVCDLLDTQMDRNCYASSMAAVIEGIADIEVDRTKILDAKDSGLDAWNVLLSMLSAYGVKADSVLEVK
jgi:hypothetical protein